MTPTGGFETMLLLLLSALAGLYVSLPQTECGKRTAGTGGVIGFLGIACPVCNKILVLQRGLCTNAPIDLNQAGAPLAGLY